MSSPNDQRPNVLCVDDEPRVLEGLAMHLRRQFTVYRATSGKQGLAELAEHGPFAVVLSDMRMPEMNGAEFLSQVHTSAPDTVRMLLTGYADIEVAASAINDGQVFRFLVKPCPPERLRLAFSAALHQYRLITAERELLEHTLRGSVEALVNVLALVHPQAFGRAVRLRELACAVAAEFGLTNSWQLEVASMLSQLGMVVLPDETLRRLLSGKELTEAELGMVKRAPKVTDDLVGKIPRLDAVREIMSAVDDASRPNGYSLEKASIEHRILAAVNDLDILESQGMSAQTALDTLRGREHRYDPEILDALGRARKLCWHGKVREIAASEARVGMVMADDVRTDTGVLVMARELHLASGAVDRLRNYPRGVLREPLRVID